MHRTGEDTAAGQPATSTTTAPLMLPGDCLRSALRLDVNAALSADATTPEHPGLPVAQLRSPVRKSKAHYVVTSVDYHGRLGDRSPMRIMDWEPGHPVAVTLAAGAIMVASRPDAREAVTRQGHLRLPASIRRACRLQPGERLLVAAHPDAGLLMAYTTSALDQMVLTFHSTYGPGDTR
jgi:hypothetical protein